MGFQVRIGWKAGVGKHRLENSAWNLQHFFQLFKKGKGHFIGLRGGRRIPSH
jgi:hypothetical protein